MSALRTGLSALLLAIGLPAYAGEILSTEVEGSVLKGRGKALGPMRALDRLAVGERMIVRAKSRAVLYVADEGTLYTITGPAEVHVTAKGLRAVQGTLAPPTQLGAGYTGLKFSIPDLVQGSLVMRGRLELRLQSPAGVVTATEARSFRWRSNAETWVFELTKDSGDLVYRLKADSGSVELPTQVTLEPGVKYVWGVSRQGEMAMLVDWTEFQIAEQAVVDNARSVARTSPMLHAVWLRQMGMPRAAVRELAFVPQGGG